MVYETTLIYFKVLKFTLECQEWIKVIFILHMCRFKKTNTYLIEILLSDHIWQLCEVELSLPLHCTALNRIFKPLENY